MLAKRLLLLLVVSLLTARAVSAYWGGTLNASGADFAVSAALPPRTTPLLSPAASFIEATRRSDATGVPLHQTLFKQTFLADASALLDVEQGDIEYLRWKVSDQCASALPSDNAMPMCDTVDPTTTPIEALTRLERAALLGSDLALHHFVDSAAVWTPDYSGRVKNLLLSTAAQGRTTALVLLAQCLAGDHERSSIVAAIGVEYAATVNRQWGSMNYEGPTIATGWTFSECFDGVQQGYVLASSLFPHRSSTRELLDVERICTPPSLR